MGGTINRLTELGKNVVYVVFSTAEQSVPDGFPKDILKTEVKAATQVLGIKAENLLIHNYEVRKLSYARQEILEELIKIRKLCPFDLVFTHSLDDVHQDHACVAQESVRAFKNTTLLGYELIWNHMIFKSQCFVKLEEKHIDTKINALREYQSQGKRNYLSADFIKGLARARGVQAGCEYAEAFEAIRLFIN
jgi:LmbE family N-acetylglucosaminyl deacetylase